MADDEEKSMEEELRANKISYMVGMFEQIGKDNGSGEQYLVAITVAAGRYLKHLPMNLRSKTVHQFLSAVRRFSGERHDA